MDTVVQCAFCKKRAKRFYITLDSTLWAVCDDHARPFEHTAVFLDPERYDLDDYFEGLLEAEP
jgi:hypothetical protein